MNLEKTFDQKPVQLPTILNEKLITGRAWFIGNRLDLREFEQGNALSLSPMTLAVGTRGLALLLKFGTVVLFGMDPVEEAEFIRRLKSFTSEPIQFPEFDGVEISIRPGEIEKIEANGSISLESASLEKLQIVGYALSKSAVLAHYEKEVAGVFYKMEQLAEQLTHGNLPPRGQELVKEIGSVLMIQARTTGRAEVTEKPEITWDRPDLDRLYERLAHEYELRDRDVALMRKLDLITRGAETYLDLEHNRINIRLEWYIVLLIVFEIFLSLIDKFYK